MLNDNDNNIIVKCISGYEYEDLPIWSFVDDLKSGYNLRNNGSALT